MHIRIVYSKCTHSLKKVLIPKPKQKHFLCIPVRTRTVRSTNTLTYSWVIYLPCMSFCLSLTCYTWETVAPPPLHTHTSFFSPERHLNTFALKWSQSPMVLLPVNYRCIVGSYTVLELGDLHWHQVKALSSRGNTQVGSSSQVTFYLFPLCCKREDFSFYTFMPAVLVRTE